jgi:hypothetical protein
MMSVFHWTFGVQDTGGKCRVNARRSRANQEKL